jgi:hypothetical protein
MGFLDDLKGSGSAPRIKFDGRDGTFTKHGSEENIAGQEWVAHIYRATGGHLKFNGKGTPPDRKMGSIFPKDEAPSRESLGDLDKTKWPAGKFNGGEPEDPWTVCVEVPMSHRETGEECLFVAQSRGSLGAIKDLLGLCRRLPEAHEPIVRFDVSSRKGKFGTVRRPVLPIIGKTAIETGEEGDAFDDKIPF